MSLEGTASHSTEHPASTSTPSSTPASLSALLSAQQTFHTSLTQRYPTFHLPLLNLYLLSLHTTLRAASTPPRHFARLLTRLIGTLLDNCLALLPYSPASSTTPTSHTFDGCALSGLVLYVSVMRAGDAFEQPLRDRLPDLSIGKLLIQRDEASPTKQAQLTYSKLPALDATATVLLCDVMLATGNSLCLAVEHLLARGYALERLLVLTVLGCPEGVQRVAERFPGVRLCCQWVDRGLNEHKYIVPGLGDAGNRYFNTLS